MNKHKIPKQKTKRGVTLEAPAGTDTSDDATLRTASDPAAQSRGNVPIVGIGASAGGLAALEVFFSSMPAHTESGMAFVVVQHLAPDHKSILSELIKRHTRMQVYEVEDGMAIHPDCAYIIPPNYNMAVLNGTLQLLDLSTPGGLRLPIDFFFRSLARDQRERAIGIILSGTGSDGTLGIRAIKGEGGMVIVQDPDASQYDGMPRSAIATGVVDFVLQPAEMPDRLIAYADHAFLNRSSPAADPRPKFDDILPKICVLLRDQTDHDFSEYKGNTLARRVERRMALHQIEQPDAYQRFLQHNPPEIEALFRDLLIGVTGFFRDPKAFEALEEQVVPRLFSGKPAGREVRIWVTGCSTGEEAYSLAILISEHLATLEQRFKVQVFATDIDRLAIEQARGGTYSTSIAADVSPGRLARFFDHDAAGGVYRVQKHIRDLLIFSEQDVIKDPPFSKLDMISCRNLLIYMNGNLQRKLIPLFHYALNPDGVLFLGSSETVGNFTTRFAPVDRKWKIYRRQTETSDTTRWAPSTFGVPAFGGEIRSSHLRGERFGSTRGGDSLRNLTEQALLQHYGAAGVLINERGDIFHIFGRTGNYLEPASGDAAMNILAMARDGLRRELTTALHRAVARNELMRYPGLRVRTNGESITVNLVVKPLARDERGPASPDLFLVIIEERPSADIEPASNSPDDAGPCAPDADGRFAGLERDLRAKEEYLQITLEELETSNEELRSSNEEMQSTNEEMQSTNEELETSKEELQSVNEELATVNVELQNKVCDLSIANNDMSNLLAGTGVGTVFVDHQLCITRFTPAATQIINLIQTDVGRPVGHIVSNLVGYDRLVNDVRTVLDALTPIEEEVQTTEGAWYLMRIRPYRTLENVIEGAVITFVDITGRKRAETALGESRELAESIVATVREPLLLLNGDLQVVRANRAFCSAFESSREDTEGRSVYALCDRQWDVPDFRKRLEEIIPQRSSFDGYEMRLRIAGEGLRKVLLNARNVYRKGDREALVLLAMEYIGGRSLEQQTDSLNDGTEPPRSEEGEGAKK